MPPGEEFIGNSGEWDVDAIDGVIEEAVFWSSSVVKVSTDLIMISNDEFIITLAWW